jgi:hypothetical protein
MTYYTELIALHPDVPMPDAGTFCPSFWQAEDFDSDGDFYADALEGRWTSLQLTRRRPDGRDSVLSVNSLREERPYDPGVQEVLDLQRFLDYRDAGRYDGLDGVAPPAAVTSLAIQTADPGDYREFLETVDGFLGFIGGVLVAPWEMDRSAFREEFLGG